MIYNTSNEEDAETREMLDRLPAPPKPMLPPEGYLEQLAQSFELLQKKPIAEPIAANQNSRFAWKTFAAAAAILLAFGTIWLYQKQDMATSDKVQVEARLSSDEIYMYLMLYPEEIEETELLASLVLNANPTAPSKSQSPTSFSQPILPQEPVTSAALKEILMEELEGESLEDLL